MLFIIIVSTSCRNTKEITMFQPAKRQFQQVPLKPKEHKIKPLDNLYISILTLDPEVNQLFNPSLAGNGLTSGTQQMFGTPESRHINGYRVSADSTITLPVLGKVNLVGLTLEKAQEHLKKRAEDYLKQPTVQVKLLNFKVNVIGEIKEPGIFYNYEGQLTIYDAISLARGITDFADLRNVIVKREAFNEIKTYNIDLTNNSVYSSEVFNLQPNDLVYVPPSGLKRNRDNATTYSQVLGTLSILLVALTLVISN